MNSGFQKRDLEALTDWLNNPENQDPVTELRETLAVAPGLLQLPSAAVEILSRFIDRFEEKRVLPGLRRAKVCKWLSAWAPAHVPMLDSLVQDALGQDESINTLAMLDRFASLVQQNVAMLMAMGAEIFSQLKGQLISPLSPVRVLDNLIWFDWWIEGRPNRAFDKWLRLGRKADVEHRITDEGRLLDEAIRNRITEAIPRFAATEG